MSTHYMCFRRDDQNIAPERITKGEHTPEECCHFCKEWQHGDCYQMRIARERTRRREGNPSTIEPFPDKE